MFLMHTLLEIYLIFDKGKSEISDDSDSDDNAMTVCLDETVTITETTYKISMETYNEIQEIAQEFEDSLRRVLVPLHADDNYEDDDEEASLEPVEAEETLAYQYRRQRRGRASKYNDIIACL